MPRHVRQKGKVQAPKSRNQKCAVKIDYAELLRDMKAKTVLERMTESPEQERRHRNCLLP